MVALFKMEYISGSIWPVIKLYMLKSRNSRHVYGNVCVVQYSTNSFLIFINNVLVVSR